MSHASINDVTKIDLLGDLLDRCSAMDGSKSIPPDDAALLTMLKMKAIQQHDSRMTIVCLDITRGIVIFPDFPD